MFLHYRIRSPMQKGCIAWTLTIDNKERLTMWVTSPGLVTEFSRAPDSREDALLCETTPQQTERGLSLRQCSLPPAPIQPILSPSGPGGGAPWEGQSPCLWVKAEGCASLPGLERWPGP